MISKTSVAIFGGSFDPVHNAHVELVTALSNTLPFQKIFVVPNGSPPHKSTKTSAEDRLQMTEIAFGNIPKVEISTFEIHKKGPAYGIHTIEHFSKDFDSIYFVLGTDAFSYLPKWYEFNKVLKACSFLVVTRKGEPKDKQEAVISSMLRDELIKETKPRSPFSKCFKTSDKTEICFLNLELPEVSSTGLREGSEEEFLIPAKVADYLKAKNLYVRTK